MARSREEVISEMVDSGLFSDDEIRSAVKQQEPAAPAPQSGLDRYQDSQLGSPAQLLQMIPDLASQVAKKAAPVAEGRLREIGVNPTAAKVAGKAIEFSPDIAMGALDPLAGAAKFIPKMAVSAQRRAMGLALPELKTIFGRGKAAEAARTMIEQGVTSKSGNPQKLFDKASALKNSVGKKIGDIRSSVGPQPIDRFIDALDQYKSKRLGGSQGGAWDKISAKIDEAKDTIRGLVGGESKSSKQIIKGKIIPGEQGSPLKKIAGTPGQPGKRNPATGFIEDEIPATDTIIVGGTPAIPASREADTVVVKGGRAASDAIMGGNAPAPKVGLDRVAEAKKELSKLVNWFSDNTSQDEAKKINGVLEKAIEGAISSSGGDIKSYKELKPIYGASKTALKGLDREIGKQQGHMAISLPSLVAGASGGPAGLAKITAFEAAKRRGAGAAVPAIMNSPKLMAPAAAAASAALAPLRKTIDEEKIREYLRRFKGNKAQVREQIKKDGYEIPK